MSEAGGMSNASEFISGDGYHSSRTDDQNPRREA